MDEIGMETFVPPSRIKSGRGSRKGDGKEHYPFPFHIFCQHTQRKEKKKKKKGNSIHLFFTDFHNFPSPSSGGPLSYPLSSSSFSLFFSLLIFSFFLHEEKTFTLKKKLNELFSFLESEKVGEEGGGEGETREKKRDDRKRKRRRRIKAR